MCILYITEDIEYYISDNGTCGFVSFCGLELSSKNIMSGSTFISLVASTKYGGAFW